MRRFLLLTALAVAVCPAAGGTILYATAALPDVPGRVDGFCVLGDGSLAPTPTVSITLGASQPRRLVVGKDPATGQDGFLFAVERDRVEAFRIGRKGGLGAGRVGQVVIDTPPMQAQDAAVSDDGRLLYVPENGPDRIVAYPVHDGRIGADDAPPFTCIEGPLGAGYRRIVVHGGFLYVSENALERVSVFPLAADGTLPLDKAGCPVNVANDARRPTCPASQHRRMGTPTVLAIAQSPGGPPRLYVHEFNNRDIREFEMNGTAEQTTKLNGLPALAAGNFAYPTFKANPIDVCSFTCHGGTKVGQACDPNVTPDECGTGGTCETDLQAHLSTIKYQRSTSQTTALQRYQDLVLFADTLIASHFLPGRIDGYYLRKDPPKTGLRTKLPGSPKGPGQGSSLEAVENAPVGMAASENPPVVYVAAGELDRVLAYRLRTNGLLASATPFSETNVRSGSFPNAVALAVLPDACQ